MENVFLLNVGNCLCVRLKDIVTNALIYIKFYISVLDVKSKLSNVVLLVEGSLS